MECPVCKDPDAYIGLNHVECLNPECVHFNEAYLEEKLRTSEQNFDGLIEDLGIGDELKAILNELWFREYDEWFVRYMKERSDTQCIPRADPGDTKCDS